jgi:paraquat-inducible protein A
MLARRPVGPRDLPLALAVTAAIVFVIANTTRLMDLSAIGRSASTTIVGGAFEMWKNGQEITGILVAFCAVLAPGGYIVFMLLLLLGARRTPVPLWVGAMLRWVQYFETWSMLEVMMLGILVALIKIAELATVHAGIGMFAVGVLILLFPAIVVTFDIRELWQRVEWDDDALPSVAPAGNLVADRAR